MRCTLFIATSMVATLFAAAGATPASAQRFGSPTIELSIGQSYPAEEYFQPGYYNPGIDYDTRANWIARERWEHRRRWEERRRWAYLRAQQHWQHEAWEHRQWHRDDDDD